MSDQIFAQGETRGFLLGLYARAFLPRAILGLYDLGLLAEKHYSQCNIPLPEYVLRYKFNFLIIFFNLLSVFVLFYDYLCDCFALDPDQ